MKWITDRLPKEGTEVLVTAAEADGTKFPLIDCILNGEWLNCDGTQWKVLAWMPISGPYTGSGVCTCS